MAVQSTPVSVPQPRASGPWTPAKRGVLGRLWSYFIAMPRVTGDCRALSIGVGRELPYRRFSDHSPDEIVFGLLAQRNVADWLSTKGVDVSAVAEALRERVVGEKDSPGRNGPRRDYYGYENLGPGQIALGEAVSVAIAVCWYWPALDPRVVLAFCIAPAYGSRARELLTHYGVSRQSILEEVGGLPRPTLDVPDSNDCPLEMVVYNNDVTQFADVAETIRRTLEVSDELASEITNAIHANGHWILLFGSRDEIAAAAERMREAMESLGIALEVEIRPSKSP